MYIVAIDQGTTSTRAIIFDQSGKAVGSSQREHEQIFPHAGWVEHDANEIWSHTREVIDRAVDDARVSASDIAGIGITNQRETTVVWEKSTGQPIAPALVWQDTRTQPLIDRLADDGGSNRFADITGLPLAAYFSASKIHWILENIDGARERAERGELLFGTIDTWLLWNLTGGADGGVHATDVTNASRTLLMNLRTLDWDQKMLDIFGVPRAMLPHIRSSSEEYGVVRGTALDGIPVAAILGDQQAATFGQVGFSQGESKNTYGTGNFLLVNTGEDIVASSNGLITTVAYQLEDEPARYALEGSIAVSGSLVQWLRDNLGIIAHSPEVEELALTVDDNGGVVIVPAFSGLFAPYWRPDARGAIMGLTRYADKGHIARAALESVALQSRDVIDAAVADTQVPISELRVDGGMVGNSTLMQFQADVLGVPVVRPAIIETTALGAAYAAGLAVGVWKDRDELRGMWREDRRWEPQITDAERTTIMARWHKAVERTFDWVDADATE
ncbi:glycerol kinase GlpK [Microbacterium sp. YY-01]|uniref:glycerol kinase GlpK n=1 Tax=Microbacterium sp. YY-01 TaxID=3421634 RepID=UPI003D16EB19